MALDCRCDRTDLSLKLLDLALLLEQDIALGSQNFVDALVVAPAHIADELSEHHGIFDRAGGSLANFGGGSLDDQPGNRGPIMDVNRCLERLLFGCGYAGAIRRALPGKGCIGILEWPFLG
jgi:hypothetical protein